MSGRSDVTRLPTAAARKVQQRHNKASREARLNLRESQARGFAYIHPLVRAATAEAQLILGCTRSPELAMVMAIWATLPDELRLKAEEKLRVMALTSESAQQAASLVKRRTLGERVTLNAALDRLTTTP
jgi:hypothetical protein